MLCEAAQSNNTSELRASHRARLVWPPWACCSRIRFPAGSLMLMHPGGPQGLGEHLSQRDPSTGTD